jgi:alkylation response protein AidB-like acyl-CoA dehydrogenase
MSDLETFREETRRWLEENCPEGARGSGPISIGSRSLNLGGDVAVWLERMAEKGWTVPTWPKEYGGAELDRDQYRVLIEELTRIGARPPLSGRGVNYIGPTLLEYGTDEQKARWLPQIARGDGAWAMGYSEPGAGSDLASLSCRAVLEGDHYVINGRKTWTSDAVDCDYIFVLVRTSPDKPKHQGISLVLVDMSQEGVQVHPIRLLSGASPFCETVFEDAVCRADDVVGGVDNGWTVGKRLLQFERSTHAGINISGSQGGRTEESGVREKVRNYVASTEGRIDEPVLRDRLVRYSMNEQAQKFTQARAVEELKSRAPGFTSSAVKLTGALLKQEGDEILVEAMGIRMLGVDEQQSKEELAAQRQWLYGKSLTIAGGTMEVQKNIIAKRVLGLPD